MTARSARRCPTCTSRRVACTASFSACGIPQMVGCHVWYQPSLAQLVHVWRTRAGSCHHLTALLSNLSAAGCPHLYRGYPAICNWTCVCPPVASYP
eukprot:2628835-Amphidinium_carterae.2